MPPNEIDPPRLDRKKSSLKGHANAADCQIGKRIRDRRNQIGISQAKLAAAIGLTFQQIQKYEHGTNRVSATTLMEIASALAVDITYFYEDLQTPVALIPPIADPEPRLLLTLLSRIDNPKHRAHLLELARILADDSR